MSAKRALLTIPRGRTGSLAGVGTPRERAIRLEEAPMRHEVDHRIEVVEGEIWDVVRKSIEAGAMVRVMESATRIAAAHHKVMPLADIAELLIEAAIAAGVPIEIEGVPFTGRGSRVQAHNSNSFGRARICVTNDPEQAP